MPDIYSRTAIETFDGCAFRFDQIINGGIEDAGDEAARGGLFHDVARQYASALYAAQTPSDFELLAETFRAIVGARPVPTAVLDDAWTILQRWGETFELDLQAYMLVEEVQVTERLRWTPDLVYVHPWGVSIPDYKTWYKGVTEDVARAAWQPRFYCWQARQIWPNFYRYEFVYKWVRSNTETVVSYTPDEIDEFAAQVEGVLERIRACETTGVWPATAGAHCLQCRLLNCPLTDKNAIVQSRILSTDDRDVASARVLALEQELKRLRAGLKGWNLLEGGWVLNGEEFSTKETITKRASARRLFQVLDAAGYPVTDVSVSASAVWKGAIKKALPAPVVTAIEGLLASSTSWTFGHCRHRAVDIADDPADRDE